MTPLFLSYSLRWSLSTTILVVSVLLINGDVNFLLSLGTYLSVGSTSRVVKVSVNESLVSSPLDTVTTSLLLILSTDLSSFRYLIPLLECSWKVDIPSKIGVKCLLLLLQVSHFLLYPLFVVLEFQFWSRRGFWVARTKDDVIY